VSPRIEAARQGRDMRIAVVAGCVAQAEGRGDHPPRACRRRRGRPQSYHHLPQLLARAKSEGPVRSKPNSRSRTNSASSPPPNRLRSARAAFSAFVTVQEGCDKFCTFCVVPYTRGAEVSRPVAKIVDDVKRLADNGVREITLIGQNVNAYHGEGPDGRTWPLWQAAASACRSRRYRAAALLHQPSPRCR